MCSVESIVLSYVPTPSSTILFEAETADGLQQPLIEASKLTDITEKTLFKLTTVAKPSWIQADKGSGWGSSLPMTVLNDLERTFTVPAALLETVKSEGIRINGADNGKTLKVEIIGESVTEVLAENLVSGDKTIDFVALKTKVATAAPGFSTIFVNGTYKPFSPILKNADDSDAGWQGVAGIVLYTGEEASDAGIYAANTGCFGKEYLTTKAGKTFTSGFSLDDMISKFGDADKLGIVIFKTDAADEE